MRFGGISTEILVWSLMVIIMIITNVYCRFIFIRRLIKDKHFSSSLAWPPWITGATSLLTAGASPPQNFDCGGDRPRRPREVGAYAPRGGLWITYQIKISICRSFDQDTNLYKSSLNLSIYNSYAIRDSAKSHCRVATSRIIKDL